MQNPSAQKKEADLDKLCGYGRWKPRPASYINRAIEGIYTNCRKPVVQKEGINYYAAFNLALVAESTLSSFTYRNKRVLDFIPRNFAFFPGKTPL